MDLPPPKPEQALPASPFGTEPQFVPVAPERPRRWGFSTAEWGRLGGFYGFIALLHISGWGLYLHHAANHPALVGLGFAAYMLGLRHAFDADHIAAVDDTVRYLLRRGQKPLGVGFFFSLGHCTVVFVLSLVVIFAAAWIHRDLPHLREYGGLIGATVSGVFLWLIGILNLVILLDLLKVFRSARRGRHTHDHLDDMLSRRGLMNRLFGGRLQKMIRHSSQMYPLGILFGLGFDTASEVALLAMTAGAIAGDLPVGAALSLPLLFAAGMCAMDTTDGVLMCGAYDWAFVNPLRRIFYNLATTGLSIAVALVIGTIELLQVAIHLFEWKGPFLSQVAALDFGLLGYVIVAIFVLGWVLSVAWWKLSRIEQRYGPGQLHAHWHDHGGVGHTHEHFH